MTTPSERMKEIRKTYTRLDGPAPPAVDDFHWLLNRIKKLEGCLCDLQKRYEILYDALTEIAFYGTSRPREMGEGDDGDEHYKRIAHELISSAAIARRKVR